MKPADFDDLDQFIDAALRHEPLRPVPFGFQRALEQRLAVQRRIAAERRRLRSIALAGCGAILAAFAALAFVGARWGNAALDNTPGLRGYLDGLTAPYAAWGDSIAGGVLLGAVVLTLIAGAVMLRPRAGLVVAG